MRCVFHATSAHPNLYTGASAWQQQQHQQCQRRFRGGGSGKGFGAEGTYSGVERDVSNDMMRKESFVGDTEGFVYGQGLMPAEGAEGGGLVPATLLLSNVLVSADADEEEGRNAGVRPSDRFRSGGTTELQQQQQPTAGRQTLNTVAASTAASFRLAPLTAAQAQQAFERIIAQYEPAAFAVGFFDSCDLVWALLTRRVPQSLLLLPSSESFLDAGDTADDEVGGTVPSSSTTAEAASLPSTLLGHLVSVEWCARSVHLSSAEDPLPSSRCPSETKIGKLSDVASDAQVGKANARGNATTASATSSIARLRSRDKKAVKGAKSSSKASAKKMNVAKYPKSNAKRNSLGAIKPKKCSIQSSTHYKNARAALPAATLSANLLSHPPNPDHLATGTATVSPRFVFRNIVGQQRSSYCSSVVGRTIERWLQSPLVLFTRSVANADLFLRSRRDNEGRDGDDSTADKSQTAAEAAAATAANVEPTTDDWEDDDDLSSIVRKASTEKKNSANVTDGDPNGGTEEAMDKFLRENSRDVSAAHRLANCFGEGRAPAAMAVFEGLLSEYDYSFGGSSSSSISSSSPSPSTFASTSENSTFQSNSFGHPTAPLPTSSSDLASPFLRRLAALLPRRETFLSSTCTAASISPPTTADASKKVRSAPPPASSKVKARGKAGRVKVRGRKVSIAEKTPTSTASVSSTARPTSEAAAGAEDGAALPPHMMAVWVPFLRQAAMYTIHDVVAGEAIGDILRGLLTGEVTAPRGLLIDTVHPHSHCRGGNDSDDANLSDAEASRALFPSSFTYHQRCVLLGDLLLAAAEEVGCIPFAVLAYQLTAFGRGAPPPSAAAPFPNQHGLAADLLAGPAAVAAAAAANGKSPIVLSPEQIIANYCPAVATTAFVPTASTNDSSSFPLALSSSNSVSPPQPPPFRTVHSLNKVIQRDTRRRLDWFLRHHSGGGMGRAATEWMREYYPMMTRSVPVILEEASIEGDKEGDANGSRSGCGLARIEGAKKKRKVLALKSFASSLNVAAFARAEVDSNKRNKKKRKHEMRVNKGRSIATTSGKYPKRSRDGLVAIGATADRNAAKMADSAALSTSNPPTTMHRGQERTMLPSLRALLARRFSRIRSDVRRQQIVEAVRRLSRRRARKRASSIAQRGEEAGSLEFPSMSSELFSHHHGHEESDGRPHPACESLSNTERQGATKKSNKKGSTSPASLRRHKSLLRLKAVRPGAYGTAMAMSVATYFGHLPWRYGTAAADLDAALVRQAAAELGSSGGDGYANSSSNGKSSADPSSTIINTRFLPPNALASALASAVAKQRRRRLQNDEQQNVYPSADRGPYWKGKSLQLRVAITDVFAPSDSADNKNSIRPLSIAKSDASDRRPISADVSSEIADTSELFAHIATAAAVKKNVNANSKLKKAPHCGVDAVVSRGGSEKAAPLLPPPPPPPLSEEGGAFLAAVRARHSTLSPHQQLFLARIAQEMGGAVGGRTDTDTDGRGGGGAAHFTASSSDDTFDDGDGDAALGGDEAESAMFSSPSPQQRQQHKEGDPYTLDPRRPFTAASASVGDDANIEDDDGGDDGVDNNGGDRPLLTSEDFIEMFGVTPSPAALRSARIAAASSAGTRQPKPQSIFSSLRHGSAAASTNPNSLTSSSSPSPPNSPSRLTSSSMDGLVRYMLDRAVDRERAPIAADALGGTFEDEGGDDSTVEDSTSSPQTVPSRRTSTTASSRLLRSSRQGGSLMASLSGRGGAVRGAAAANAEAAAAKRERLRQSKLLPFDHPSRKGHAAAGVGGGNSVENTSENAPTPLQPPKRLREPIAVPASIGGGERFAGFIAEDGPAASPLFGGLAKRLTFAERTQRSEARQIAAEEQRALLKGRVGGENEASSKAGGGSQGRKGLTRLDRATGLGMGLQTE